MLSNKPRFQRGKCVIRAISKRVLETTKSFSPKNRSSQHYYETKTSSSLSTTHSVVTTILLHRFVAPLCCTTLLHHIVAPLCCTTLLHHIVVKNTENGSLVGTSVAFSIFVGTMLYRVLFSRGFPRMYFLKTSTENTFGNDVFQQHPLGISFQHLCWNDALQSPLFQGLSQNVFSKNVP